MERERSFPLGMRLANPPGPFLPLNVSGESAWGSLLGGILDSNQ